MIENVFIDKKKKIGLDDYMDFEAEGRGNLGAEIPVKVYRLMEYSLREQLIEQLGEEAQIQIFRDAGYRAGTFFAKNLLDLSLPFGQFAAALQTRLEEMKIGVLRIENYEKETGKIVLTVSEDADCSGLPLFGETVCNYDEGFISGIMSEYTKKKYYAKEVDCWATGDRVCRFHVGPVV